MTKQTDLLPSELAMRIVLRVQTRHRHNPDFRVNEMVKEIVSIFGIHRATAYRRLRQAMDVLGIPDEAIGAVVPAQGRAE